MKYLKVKNWQEFQHYKDRNPPWIKLHNALLDDYEFCALSDASKFQLSAIWLLASRSDNRVPADPEWIRGKISATTPVDIRPLVAAGFLMVIDEENQPSTLDDKPPEQAASKALSLARSQEAETESEESRDKKPPVPLARDGGAEPPAEAGAEIPAVAEMPAVRDRVAEVFDHWRQALNHPRAVLDMKRRKVIGNRLKDGYTVEDLKQAIDGVRRSRHHMGHNDTGAVFDDIELICRDAKHVDGFRKLTQQGAAIVPPPARRSLPAATSSALGEL